MKGKTGRPKRARPAAGRRVGAASPRPDLLAEFVAELLDGHKGPAVLVPFDPQDAWQTPPRTIENPAYGKSSGHLVRGTLNGHPFDGWIGCRWGRFFLLVGEDLQKAARVAVGDSVRVVVGPRSSPDETKRPARTEEPGTQPARWASRRGRDEARTKPLRSADSLKAAVPDRGASDVASALGVSTR